MEGSIIEFLIEMTGLPTDQVTTWLRKEVSSRGLSWNDISEKEIRGLLADILETSIKSQASELN